MCALSDYLKQLNSILPINGEIRVEAIEEGFTNKVYKILESGQPKWVLRLPMPESQCFQIDRQTELSVWQQAAQQGLTSQILWHNPQGVVLSEFLTGSTLPLEVQHTQASIEQVCRQLKRLHDMPPIKLHYDVQSIIADWLEQIRLHENFVSVSAQWRQVSNWFEALPTVALPEHLVLAHNDLNPKNLIIDGQKLWLIDWESAGMNDPLFDVAVLAHSQHLQPEHIEIVCQSLLGQHFTSGLAKRVLLYRKLYVVRELVWLLLKHLTAPQELNGLEWYHVLATDPDFNPYFDN